MLTTVHTIYTLAPANLQVACGPGLDSQDMPRAILYAYQQPSEEKPAHRIPSSALPHLLSARLNGVKVMLELAPGVFRLQVQTSWHELKRTFLPERNLAMRVRRLPSKLKPSRGPEGLMLSYPPKDFSSFAKRHQKDVWGGSAEEFANRVGKMGISE